MSVRNLRGRISVSLSSLLPRQKCCSLYLFFEILIISIVVLDVNFLCSLLFKFVNANVTDFPFDVL